MSHDENATRAVLDFLASQPELVQSLREEIRQNLAAEPAAIVMRRLFQVTFAKTAQDWEKLHEALRVRRGLDMPAILDAIGTPRRAA